MFTICLIPQYIVNDHHDITHSHITLKPYAQEHTVGGVYDDHLITFSEMIHI